MNHSIDFGSRKIEFTLVFSERKTLGISVMPDLKIIVKAPFTSPLENIFEKIYKKAPWILKQQSYFLSFNPRNTEKRFISGESHPYLGRQYQLKVILSIRNTVHYKGRFIEIQTKNKSKTKYLLKEWYREKAKEKFEEFAEPIIHRFKKYQVNPAGIYILEMPTRWGSCTPKGKIILNPELIKAPRGCIEYVIIHELCHLVHHNHTQKFIDLQNKEMPGWEKWKTKLEKFLA